MSTGGISQLTAVASWHQFRLGLDAGEEPECDRNRIFLNKFVMNVLTMLQPEHSKKARIIRCGGCVMLCGSVVCTFLSVNYSTVTLLARFLG